MSQTTVKYSNNFSGSIGAGMKSVFGSNGRKYYELVHKTSSRYHTAGAVQKIIIDNIELGRDAKCQVRYDESFPTVSRHHAAIVKDGDGWRLIHLSKKNSTFLNGNKVEDNWYLQNGDEIQLSAGGPKLGFVIPQGEAGLVKSIGLTNRLSLFRKQALRPYKTALWCLLATLLAACAVGGWLLYKSNTKLKDTRNDLKDTQEQLIEAKDALAQLEQQQQELKENTEKTIKSITAKRGQISSGVTQAQKKLSDAAKSQKGSESSIMNPEIVDNKSLNAAIDALVPGVYFIYTEGFDITNPDGRSFYAKPDGEKIPGWSGTGFLLSDGRFVTARHVIEAWEYWDNEKDPLYDMNLLVNNGGKIVAHFNAMSSTGDNIRFTNEQMIMNDSHDQHGVDADGYKLSTAVLDNLDYAYMIFGKSGPLVPDVKLSSSLERMTELTVLGFPLGLGASAKGISPVYGNATVAVTGLQNGGIVTTNTNYEHGNSGGPVLAKDNSGKLVVVGIVSGGAGRNIGIIVPISSIY